jgi:hypothetical protein
MSDLQWAFDQANAESKRLTADLARVTEERDALRAAAQAVLDYATIVECHNVTKVECQCHECATLRALRAAVEACK